MPGLGTTIVQPFEVKGEIALKGTEGGQALKAFVKGTALSVPQVTWTPETEETTGPEVTVTSEQYPPPQTAEPLGVTIVRICASAVAALVPPVGISIYLLRSLALKMFPPQ
jgi:hypothetical protein